MAASTILLVTSNGTKLGGQLVRYPKNATGQLVFCGEGHSVEEVYGRPSIYKKNAERDIIAEMDAAGGYGYTVLNHNGFYFSCGYYVEDRVGVLYFVKHTHAGRYICECDERGQYISSKRVAALDNVKNIEALHLKTFYMDIDDMRDDIAAVKKMAFKTLRNVNAAPTSCAGLITQLTGADYYAKLIEICDDMSAALDIFENNGGRYSMSFDAWAHMLHNEAELDAAADYIAAAWPCL